MPRRSEKRPQAATKGRSITAVACAFQRKRGGTWELGLWIEQASRIIDMDGKLIRSGVYNYELVPYAGVLVLPEGEAR